MKKNLISYVNSHRFAGTGSKSGLSQTDNTADFDEDRTVMTKLNRPTLDAQEVNKEHRLLMKHNTIDPFDKVELLSNDVYLEQRALKKQTLDQKQI